MVPAYNEELFWINFHSHESWKGLGSMELLPGSDYRN